MLSLRFLNLQLQKHLFDRVCFRFKPGMSPNKQSLSPRDKLHMYLYHIGGDIRKHYGALQFKCSPSAYCNAIEESIDVLHEILVPQMICLPTPEEARRQSVLFRERSGFRADAWCAIDGLLIKVNFLAKSYFILFFLEFHSHS